MFSRRDFLKLAGKAGLVAPFALGPAGCALTGPGFEADTGLSLGTLSGDVTPDGAVVWLRAEPGSRVAVEYGKEPELAAAAVTAPVEVSGESDYTARFLLGGLEPATVYYYRAAVAGKKPGPVARFKTAPAPDALAPVKFCFSGDTRENYKPFTIMDAIRAARPDFFIHLGDTIYADRGGSATTRSEFWAKYRANRNDAPSRRLFAETSFNVIWDDHEVRDNYDGGSHPLAAVGQKAFLDYWPLRRDAAEPNRIYRSFRWGKGLELFLLDNRQYRDRAHGSMLGSRQKEWLSAGLAASDAAFKVIASSVPFYGGGYDRWDGFPAERKELMHFIRQKKISGVTLISADLHFAAVAKVSHVPGVKEVVVGPMAAQMNIFAIGYSSKMDFFENKTFNFGTITVDPKASPPELKIEIRDENNRSLYKTEVGAVV